VGGDGDGDGDGGGGVRVIPFSVPDYNTVAHKASSPRRNTRTHTRPNTTVIRNCSNLSDPGLQAG